MSKQTIAIDSESIIAAVTACAEGLNTNNKSRFVCKAVNGNTIKSLFALADVVASLTFYNDVEVWNDRLIEMMAGYSILCTRSEDLDASDLTEMVNAGVVNVQLLMKAIAGIDNNLEAFRNSIR